MPEQLPAFSIPPQNRVRRALAYCRQAFWGKSGTIEQRLFRGLSLLSGLLAICVVVPMNLAQQLPVFVSICVFAFGVAALLLWLLTHRGYFGMRLLLFLHLANLDLVWFSNAGSQGSIGMFLFAAAMYIVIFFEGWTRWTMLGFYLINGVGLFWVERNYPQLVQPYVSGDARYMDLVTGFVLFSLMCVLILWVVLAAYHRERDRLSEALAAQSASEARFRSLVMNAPIPITVMRLDGSLDYVNHTFKQVLGYTTEDLPDIEAWWTKAYPDPVIRERARAHWDEACAKAVATGTTVPPSEYLVASKHGTSLQLEIQAAAIGDRWLVMFTDISDRRRSEQAMRQAQKLESLGVLAGGIAHDFNNLLSAMLSNLNMAQMKLTVGAASGPYLENMEGTIRKAAELTRQMLAYSGRGHFVVEPLSLSRLVGEITHLLAVSISKKVLVEYDLASNLPAIEADAAQVQQVIMNLVTNASEAIGEAGGVIRISTARREISADDLASTFAGQGLEPGVYVALRVEDSGCGMDPQIKARIFDPFFSTKGSGRGLGLSAMDGILRGHKAGIEIQSETGKGSVFHICFRASQAEIPMEIEREEVTHPGRFDGKILLVDDEAELRFSYGSMLQHLGFQVVAARDGFEALERFQPREFKLVFMDLTMPRMDGQEAFLQMKARDPEVKVVLVSGYSEREATETLSGLRPAAFLQKPFSLQALTAVLEKVLG